MSVLTTLELISLTLMSNGDLDIEFKSSMPTVGGNGAILFLIESVDEDVIDWLITTNGFVLILINELELNSFVMFVVVVVVVC